jgi:hypothetical protein
LDADAGRCHYSGALSMGHASRFQFRKAMLPRKKL